MRDPHQTLMKYLLYLLLAVACFAQGKKNIVETGTINGASSNRIPPTYTFASPPDSPPTGAVYVFTDASSAGTCSGGGSALALCRWSGSAWGALGGSGGGGGGGTPGNRIDSIALPVAVCGGAVTGATGFSTPSSNAPTPDCIAGSNSVLLGRLLFAAGATSTASYQVLLPYNMDCSSSMDLVLTWRAAATSGSVTWQVQTQFVAAGSTIDGAAYNAVSTVAHAPQGTTLQIRKDSITGITKTGCAADTQMLLRISRLGTGADTMTGDAELIGAQLRYARAY